MKKIYSLVFACTLLMCSIQTQAQTLNESFEGTFPPTGWTRINAGTGNNWSQVASSNLTANGLGAAQDGSFIAGLIYHATNAANSWLITPVQNLTSGTPYIITFYYRVGNTGTTVYPEKLKVTIGNAATVAAQTTTLWDNNGGTELTNTTWQQGTINYTPSSSGTFYFGFNGYSAADQYILMLDNVKISAFTACTGTPSAGNASASSNILCSAGPVTLDASNVTTSTGLAYIWQSSAPGANSWTDIPGATTLPYTASVTTSTDYRLKVTCIGSGSFAYSTPVAVKLSGAPANDNVCGAINLTLNGAANCGNTTCATATGDPAFTPSTPNNTVWYTYTPTVSGPAFIKMTRPAGVTSGFLNAWVGVFTATGACPSLTLTEEAGNALNFDLTTVASDTNATTSLTAGTTYYLMVDGFSGSFGEYCISIVTPPVAPTCTTVTSPANNATNVALHPLSLSWNAVPNGTAYDLYIDVANPPSTTPVVTDIVGTTIDLIGGAYNTTYYWYVVPKNNGNPAVGCASSVASFTTSAPPPPPVNDECINAISISPYNGTMTGSTISGTPSAGIAVCGGTQPGTPDEDVWYKFTALQNGAATITVAGQGVFDAVLQLFTGTCGSLTQVGACVDATLDGETEVMSLTGLVAGTTYYLRVYSWEAGIGDKFTITATGVALPITLSDFRGVRQGGRNALSWTTQAEQNNTGFELQRSADGKNFTGLTFIASKASNGNSSSALQYHFDDAKPLSGTNYYRLKQVDKDGKSILSNIVSLKGDKATSIQLTSVYPNPALNVLNVVVASPASERINFVVTDLAGKTVMQQNRQLVVGDNNLSLDVQSLPSGSYFIKAVCNTGCETAVQKFVKQ
jgi:hypothetical protein